MLKIGLRDVRDVATLISPTYLSDNIKFLGLWRAEEMVQDARVSCCCSTIFLDLSMYLSIFMYSLSMVYILFTSPTQMRLSQEAMELAAESHDRQAALLGQNVHTLPQ